jgi:hypothetical protein
VLNPRTVGAVLPEDHRPITMGSVIGRVYHKMLAKRMTARLLVSNRQKAFRQGYGNVAMQSIVRDHIASLTAPHLSPLLI